MPRPPAVTPASASSSIRTVRPRSSHNTTNPTETDNRSIMDYDPPATSNSISTIRPHHLGHFPFPPIPPARTSSLANPILPTSGDTKPEVVEHGLALPSVQVIGATPTKGKRIKSIHRRSAGSGSTGAGSDSPPLGRKKGIKGGLNVKVESEAEGVEGPGFDRTTWHEEEEDEEDDVDEEGSEELRAKEALADAKIARVREKGRLRQRRKREKDKLAREVSRLLSHRGTGHVCPRSALVGLGNPTSPSHCMRGHDVVKRMTRAHFQLACCSSFVSWHE
jgi:hypothetical protein